jgi:hypothetical protein
VPIYVNGAKTSSTKVAIVKNTISPDYCAGERAAAEELGQVSPGHAVHTYCILCAHSLTHIYMLHQPTEHRVVKAIITLFGRLNLITAHALVVYTLITARANTHTEHACII